ncbi:thioesterase family protein [Rhodococcus sp. HM1]|uniref:thioesterase family protein n=1 Tax=unclassified Rhodococcus (in: high G+C Gram-positive bacteria) TaxID=192944 RepID=UPI0018CCE3D4|nr:MULTISPECIES: thioesterase family protein [unclassified Rhodococcus (in: high G+C Gram-positive bacteria)]MBH0120745.1 thioesterase family protein [Rhodococcus sp. CX]MCK8673546.1 thioesterase family protein [Rhodococcus sp. HM1]
MNRVDGFYERRDETTFESTPATAGPWGPQAQHAGPPSALLTGEIERHHVADGQRLGGVSVDILAPIPVAPITVTTSVVRPGRRTALIQATGVVGERPVLSVRAWRLARVDDDYPAVDPTPPVLDTDPDHAQDGGVIPGANTDGYLAATQFRFTTGSFAEFGPAAAWGRSLCALVAGEEPSPWQRVLILADSSSGMSLAAHPGRFPAINADLHVVLHRDPVGDWIGIDAVTHSMPGHGAAAYARLSDTTGLIGTCAQTLYASTVR